MKAHIFRPLYVVLALVALIFTARLFFVPLDFGSHEKGYMYGWHRKANEDEWKQFKVKYKSSEYCKDCHSEQYSSIKHSAHFSIQCENCHGPGLEHPEEPTRLSIDKSKGICLRCHSYLPYPSSNRAHIKGISPDNHHPDTECVMCHNPHKPSLEGMG